MLHRQAILPRMRLLWIALAAATAITIAAVGGLVIGPRLAHHHRLAGATAIAHRDIGRLDLAAYWRARHHDVTHVHSTRVLASPANAGCAAPPEAVLRTIDPWGTPYRMTPSGQGYAIISAGPDHVFGTADDVR
jgi:hypothetical protein